MAQARFSPLRSKFLGQIKQQDNLQKSDGIAPATKKWQDFGWETEDSDYVTKTNNHLYNQRFKY